MKQLCVWLIVALVIPLTASVAQAQEEKHPITHEDLWLMKRVGAPAVSPDGKWVVFLVNEPAYDDKEKSADLWIVPGDGSAAPRRLTANKARESDVTWSEDSRRIAFSTKREGDEVEQIYVMDVAAGGEAARVTNISTGARSPQFSPDGGRLLFVSTVYRGALTGGGQALGRPSAGLGVGEAADIVSLKADDPTFAGRSGDAILDSWIFGGAARLVDCVWRGGVKRVAGGRHVAREAIDARYRAAVGALLA